MAFDPDAYLLGKQDFNPDEYLSKFDPDKYLGTSKAEIPGTPPQPKRPVTDEEKDAAFARNIAGIPLGIAEQGLNLLGGVGGMLIGAPVAGSKAIGDLLTGKETNFQKDYESIVGAAGSGATQLLDFLGEDSDSRRAIQKGAEETIYKSLGALPIVGGYVGPMGPFGRSKTRPIETPKIEPKLSKEDIIRQEKEVAPPPEEIKPPIPNEAQMELPREGMIQAPQYGVMEGVGRIDEHGIPIRADLSMEARNLEQPLQRNLWGDELPRKAEQEAPLGLTAALDEMKPEYRSPAIWRTGLAEELASSPELKKAIDTSITEHLPKEGPFRLQGGAIDLKGIHEGMRQLLNKSESDLGYFGRWRTTFNPKEYAEALNALEKPNSRETIALLSPDEFHTLAKTRPQYMEAGSEIKRDAVRIGLKTKEGLDQIPYLRLSINGDTAKVESHNGRHRMDVFKEQGITAVPVRLRLTDGSGYWGARQVSETLPKTIMGENGVSITMPKILTKDRSPRDLSSVGKDSEFMASQPDHELRLIDKNVDIINNGFSGRQRGSLLIPGQKPPKPDTITHPTSPEQIAAKTDLEKKALALKLKDTPYERVLTKEDALSNPGKDLSSNVVRDYVGSGISGQIYRNTKNRVLKFAREMFDEAKETQEAYSTKYVTGDTGVSTAYRKLSKGEWADVVEALQEGSKQKVKLTESMMDKMGMSDNQKSLINKIYGALDEMYSLANDALMSQGFEPFKYHEGYVPSMFNGSYTTLVRKGDRTISVVQADNKWAWKKGKEYFKNKEGLTFIDLPRKGLRSTTGYSRVFDGFNNIIAEMARLDPEFGNLKAEVDHHMAESTKKLYQFDVHEKRKTGVQGAMGDKPWLDKQANAKEFLEGLINYLEEGSTYYTLQKPLNEVGSLVKEPSLRETHPNTVKYLEAYIKHNKGENISPIGAASNWVVDSAFALAGLSPDTASKATSGLRTLSTLHMMGIYNPGFLATQLTQYFTGGMPEALQLRNTLGLSPTDLTASWGKMTLQFSQIASEKILKKEFSTVDPHLREAFDWAQEQGMLHFSEAELAKSVVKNPALVKAKEIASWPITLGEMATRPAIFLWYTDLFHKAGVTKDAGLYRMAKDATDYAMTNYHPSERPMIYESLGYMGQFLGALTTYKHNLMDQWVARGAGASKNPGAFAAMLGFGYAFYGLLGFPGAQETDQITQAVAGRTLRELLLDNSTKPNAQLDGLLSAYTGLDFQARLSMSNLIPDSPGQALAGPHLANAASVMVKALQYAKERDVASRNALITATTPLGMRGFVEEGLMTDKEGYLLTKEGERKYETKRGINERGMDERLWRKWMGMRPIRERLEDEDLYADDKAYRNMTTKQKEAMSRFKSAINFNDDKGAEQALADYQEEGGDPKNLRGNIKRYVQERGLSERERRGIAPKGSIGSINKYKEYHD